MVLGKTPSGHVAVSKMVQVWRFCFKANFNTACFSSSRLGWKGVQK